MHAGRRAGKAARRDTDGQVASCPSRRRAPLLLVSAAEFPVRRDMQSQAGLQLPFGIRVAAHGMLSTTLHPALPVLQYNIT